MDMIRCKHCELVLTEDVNEACGFCPNCYENSRPGDAWQEPLPPADALKLADTLLREADPEAWREQKAMAFIREHADAWQLSTYSNNYSAISCSGDQKTFTNTRSADTTKTLIGMCRWLCDQEGINPKPWMRDTWLADEPCYIAYLAVAEADAEREAKN